MHGNSHEGMVLSSVLSLTLPTLSRVIHLIVGCARRVFVIACITLFCLLNHMLLCFCRCNTLASGGNCRFF